MFCLYVLYVCILYVCIVCLHVYIVCLYCVCFVCLCVLYDCMFKLMFVYVLKAEIRMHGRRQGCKDGRVQVVVN